MPRCVSVPPRRHAPAVSHLLALGFCLGNLLLHALLVLLQLQAGALLAVPVRQVMLRLQVLVLAVQLGAVVLPARAGPRARPRSQNGVPVNAALVWQPHFIISNSCFFICSLPSRVRMAWSTAAVSRTTVAVCCCTACGGAAAQAAASQRAGRSASQGCPLAHQRTGGKLFFAVLQRLAVLLQLLQLCAPPAVSAHRGVICAATAAQCGIQQAPPRAQAPRTRLQRAALGERAVALALPLRLDQRNLGVALLVLCAVRAPRRRRVSQGIACASAALAARSTPHSIACAALRCRRNRARLQPPRGAHRWPDRGCF